VQSPLTTAPQPTNEHHHKTTPDRLTKQLHHHTATLSDTQSISTHRTPSRTSTTTKTPYRHDQLSIVYMGITKKKIIGEIKKLGNQTAVIPNVLSIEKLENKRKNG